MQGPFTLSKSNRHNTISEDELQRFKTNYIFMWTALGTSPHLADSERDSYDVNSRIRGHEFLPSRATLFACSRDGYVPSRNTVFKIVDFFNANFTQQSPHGPFYMKTFPKVQCINVEGHPSMTKITSACTIATIRLRARQMASSALYSKFIWQALY